MLLNFDIVVLSLLQGQKWLLVGIEDKQELLSLFLGITWAQGLWKLVYEHKDGHIDCEPGWILKKVEPIE